MTSSFCIATRRRPHAFDHLYIVSNHPHPNEPQLFHPLWSFLVLVSHLTWTKLFSIFAYDGKQCVHGTVLAGVFFSLASAHEISFLYLGTVEPRKWDKVRG